MIVRNDTGVFEGGEISMFYDPMIAKLCTWAPTRDEAVEAMAESLDAFEVEGIGHNLPFLSAVMDHPRFREGRITTAFIAEEYPGRLRRRDARYREPASRRGDGGDGAVDRRPARLLHLGADGKGGEIRPVRDALRGACGR